jgi:hypothetical protein
MLVDSGASVSVMKPGISHSEIHPPRTEAKGITGNRLKTVGTQDISVSCGKEAV